VSRRERIAPLLPHAVFGLLFLATFNRWMLPFHDHARDIHTAARLAGGELLYRDVGWHYGPLPPYLDALALAVFGKSLATFLWLRTAFALLGVEALRRLCLRLIPDRLLAAVAAAFTVATCFFLGLGGTYAFPYSIAALEGTVGTWWAVELALAAASWPASLLAGLVAGLAAGAKLEFVPAALAGCGFALLCRRPRRETLSATALATLVAAAAYLGPILLLGRETLVQHGLLVASRVPDTWRRFYEVVFYGGHTRDEFLSFGWLYLIPSALLFAAVLFLSRAAPERPRVPLTAALGVLGALAGWAIPQNGELHVLLPFAVAALLLEALALWKERGDPARVAAVSVGLAALPALARQPFLLAISTYGAFAAPLALVTSLGFLARRLRPGAGFTAFLAGLALAQMHARATYYRTRPMEKLVFARGSFYLPPDQAAVVKLGVQAIERTTPPGAYVAVFPEPGLFLFLTGRRNPFVDEVNMAGMQTPQSEAEMIAALDTHRPAAGLVLDISMDIWGVPTSGIDHLTRFRAEFLKRMQPVAVLGGAGPGAVKGTFYLPKP